MPDPENDLQVHLAKLKRKYVAGLTDKVAAIEACFAAFLAQPWTEEAAFTAYRQIHSLAGSAGTYGFGAITETAREVEAVFKRSLESRETVPPAERARVDLLMKQLREQAAGAVLELPR